MNPLRQGPSLASTHLPENPHDKPLPICYSQEKLQLIFPASWTPETPRTAFDATGLFVSWKDSFTEQEKIGEAAFNKKASFSQHIEGCNSMNFSG